MLFSSLVFLYLFLPITLLGYYVSPGKVKNYWLLLTSLIFFAWGGVSLTALLLISIILNYFFGICIQKNINEKYGTVWLRIGVSVNILFLGVFKYTDFIIQNLNELFGLLQIPSLPSADIILPIGISFYTFHSISYLVDIHRRKTAAQNNIFNLALYICMFSQLIAGPIIRYSDVWLQLTERKHTLEKFSLGIERFLIGLAKKVLLANNFAFIADQVFTADTYNMGALNAWLGIICYTLQIYCDFAGYSDMAIGLGKMFGFEFMENFNFPYLAQSVKEFWRRWHISLSSFFRDYVYIPLGGNKKSQRRTYINLLMVFFLTGFWHGAGWSFVVWGLFHGLFMMLERLGFDRILEKIWKPLANVYTMFVVMFAWVLFRADTLPYALGYWRAMFDFNSTAAQWSSFMSHMNPEFIFVLIIALSGSFGLLSSIGRSLRGFVNTQNRGTTVLVYGYHFISFVFYGSILMLSTLYLVAGTYNPFIYFRF